MPSGCQLFFSSEINEFEDAYCMKNKKIKATYYGQIAIRIIMNLTDSPTNLQA